MNEIELVKWPDGKTCKHPSDFFKRNCLNCVSSMTNKEIAENLEVTPKYLSSFLNEEVSIEVNFAVKLAKFTGFCEGTWLELQRKYDLYRSRNPQILTTKGSAAGILKNIPTNKKTSDDESLQSMLDGTED